MIIQVFKTHCENCGEEVQHRAADFTGTNEIILDFIDGMEFDCECGTTTYVDINKFS